MLINEKQDQAEQILQSPAMSHGFGQVNLYADRHSVSPLMKRTKMFLKT